MEKTMPKVETRRITAYITTDAYIKLKHIAAVDRVSMTGELERMIQERAERDFPELNNKSVYD